MRRGQITDAKWTDDPDFNKAKFRGKPYGTDGSKGADPKVFLPLAGFPRNDKRWKEKPWNTVTPANCGSKRRSIFDNFEDEEMQLVTRDNEDIELVTGCSEDMQLVPRGRSRSKRLNWSSDEGEYWCRCNCWHSRRCSWWRLQLGRSYLKGWPIERRIL